MAVASLVCGILGLVMFWACFVGLALGIVATVLGVIGRKKASQLPGETGSGLALGGIITGAIGTLVGIVMVILLFVSGTSDDSFDDYNSDSPDGFCDQDRFWQDPDC